MIPNIQMGKVFLYSVGHADIAQLHRRREADFLKDGVVHNIVEHLVTEHRSPGVSVRTYIKVICDDTSVFSLIGRSIEKS